MNFLKQIFTNASGEYSTTNFIQICALLALIVGFFIALFLNRDGVLEIMVIALTSIAIATPATKGFSDFKRGK